MVNLDFPVFESFHLVLFAKKVVSESNLEYFSLRTSSSVILKIFPVPKNGVL
jgi:hypothetical protein